MSPTPVTFTSPTAAGVVQLGGDRRGGRGALRRARSSRSSGSTSTPPRPRRTSSPRCWPPAGSRRRCPSTRRPTTAGWSRPRPPATASTTDELLVGAGADEILDIVAKVFLPPGDRAVVPTPSYAMYRVLTEQRGAAVVAVPRRGASRMATRWIVDAVRAAAARRRRSSGCAARTTRRPCPSPTAPSRRCSPASPRTPPPTAARPPIVVLDEAYAEFVGRSLVGLRDRLPEPHRRPHRQQGLRAGRAAGRLRASPARRSSRGSTRTGRPGSVSTVSVTVVTEALLRRRRSSTANIARVERERDRLPAALRRRRLVRRAVGHELPARRLRVARSGPRAVAEGLLRRGLVPRTFPAGHPLADSPAPDRPRRRRERPAHRRAGAATSPRETAHDDAARRARPSAPREARRVTVARTTRETDITVTLGLDGAGHAADRDRGRLLRPPAGLVRPPRPVRPGDPAPMATSQVDEHHTVEDVALVLGAAFAEALGDRAGHPPLRRRARADGRVARHGRRRRRRPAVRGHRPAVPRRAGRRRCRSSSSSTRSSRSRGPPGATLHLRGTGRNDHHLAEAAFKALARALRDACEPDPRRDGRRLDEGLARMSAARRGSSPSSTTAPATSSASSRR